MRLLTLGGLTLEGSRLRPSKPLLLLALLSLEGPKDRRYLAELFWPAATDPLNSLSTALSHLRKVGSGVVEADEARAWTPLPSDASELLSILNEGAWQRGCELYAGRFLDGLHLRDWGPELEEWVYGTREFIAGRVREAHLRLAEAEAARRQFESAATLAETAFVLSGAAEPEPDDLRRMHTLLLAGKSMRADEVRREAESYGIEVDRTADKARERLSGTASMIEHSALGALPASATSFVGREDELAELRTLFGQPEVRLVTVNGPGGVGKSRLALQLARDQPQRDGEAPALFFLPLDAIGSPEAIPSSLAALIGAPLSGNEDALTEVSRFVGDRHLLIILDNYEHLIEGAGIAATLIESCPNLSLIVTSRERLLIDGEWTFELEGLPFPASDRVSPERAMASDAVQLFVQRARRASHRFALTAENASSVLRICRLVEGLPLGLELAAAWSRIMTPREIADEIAKNLDFLASPARDATARHRGLRATFEYSWDLLSESEQVGLRRLSVFRGGFRREAAAEVSGTTIPGLASLVDKSLLRVLPNGRYGRHSLLYQYTQEKLAEHPEERTATERRHAEHYHRLLQEQGAQLRGPEQRAAMATIEEELENLQSAWQWAIATLSLDDLRRSLRPFVAFFDKRARVREGVEVLAQLDRFLDETDPEHRALLASAWVEQAWFYLALGRTEEASELAERGVEALRPVGDLDGLWTGLVTLANVARHTGDYPRAKTHFEELLTLARSEKRESLPGALNNVATVEEKLGNFGLAMRYYQEALALNRRHGDFERIVKNLNNLGTASLHTNGPEQAIPILQEGLALAREIGYRQAVPHLLLSEAEATLALGEVASASTLGREALELAAEVGDSANQARASLLLGRVALAQGDDLQSRSRFERSLAIATRISATPLLLEILIRLAELWIEQGQSGRAGDVLALVLNHPATERWVRDRARQLVETMPERSASDASSALQHGAAASTLERVLEEILGPAFEPGPRLTESPRG